MLDARTNAGRVHGPNVLNVVPINKLDFSLPGACMLGKEFNARKHAEFFDLDSEESCIPTTISISNELDSTDAGNCETYNSCPMVRRFFGHTTHKKVSAHSHMFVFYNIFTMYESQKAEVVGITTGRRATPDEYFHQLGATVVGVAESRTRAKRCETDIFLIVSSGSQRNSLGCEVWIAKLYPFIDINGKLSSIIINHSNIVLIFASPRILLTSCTINNVCTYYLVFHAPHEQWDTTVRAAFFKELQCVAEMGKNAHLVTLGDVNGRVGSVTSGSIGNWAPEPQSSNGEMYHRFVKNINAFVPSTFSDFANGTSYSFKNCKRIDYISVPMKWKAKGGSAGSCPLIDDMAMEEDHIPVYTKHDLYHANNMQAWIRRRMVLFTIPNQIDSETSVGFRELAMQSSMHDAMEPNEAIDEFHDHMKLCCSKYSPKCPNIYKK